VNKEWRFFVHVFIEPDDGYKKPKPGSSLTFKLKRKKSVGRD
jgi:hypothetical protein